MEKKNKKIIIDLSPMVVVSVVLGIIVFYGALVWYLSVYHLALGDYTQERLQLLANLGEYINTKLGLPVAILGTFIAIILAALALVLALKQTRLEESMQYIDAAMFYNKTLDEQIRIYSRLIAILHKLARTTYEMHNRYSILACDICNDAKELAGDVTENKIQDFVANLNEISEKSRAISASDEKFTRLSNEYCSAINELIGFLNEINEKHWEDYISHGIWEQLRFKTFFEIFLEKHEDLNIDRGDQPIKMELHMLIDYLSSKLKTTNIISNVCNNTSIKFGFEENKSETDRIQITTIDPELRENGEIAYLYVNAYCIQKEFNFISSLDDAGKILSKDVYKLTFNMALNQYSDFNKNSDVMLSLLNTVLKAESEIKSYLTSTICKLYDIEERQLEKRVNFRKIPLILEGNSNLKQQIETYANKFEDPLKKLQIEREKQIQEAACQG